MTAKKKPPRPKSRRRCTVCTETLVPVFRHGRFCCRACGSAFPEKGKT